MKLTPKAQQPQATEIVIDASKHQIQTGTLFDFKEWAVAKYNELNERINPCNSKGEIDPVRLNQVLTTLPGDFSWATVMLEVESNKLSNMQLDYENWYKQKYSDTYKAMQIEACGARMPSQATIEARIVDNCSDEMLARRREIADQEGRVGVMKGLIKVLERQCSLLQTLASNMRSELYFSGTLVTTSVGKASVSSGHERAKQVLQEALGTGVELGQE